MIQHISRRTFDAFNPERPSIAVNRFEEVEWVAERSKVVIGFVARDRIRGDWTIGVKGATNTDAFMKSRAKNISLTRRMPASYS
jgi:hypothetical protein